MSDKDILAFEIEIALTQERLATLKMLGESNNLEEFNKRYNEMIRKENAKHSTR